MSEGDFETEEAFSASIWEDEELSEVPGEDTSSDFVRSDIVTSIVSMLSADAERCDGILNRADADLAYFRKNLSIAECIEVEQQIRSAGYKIIEDESLDVSEERGKGQRNRRFLSESEEKELGRQIQLALRLPENRDGLDSAYVERVLQDADKARALFVATNVYFVEMMARRLGNRQTLTLDDLVQEGLIGLLKAAEKYDPGREFRFKTYASWWIQQQMSRAIDDGDRTIRLPIYVAEKIRRIKRSKSLLAVTRGKEPSDDELAVALGMDAEKLTKLMWLAQATDCLEADAPRKNDDTPLLSLIEDENPTPFEVLAFQQLKERFRAVLDTLSPREAMILRMRFGIDIDQGYTLDSIGKKLDITRERVRQIEASALKKLKNGTRFEQLKDFKGM